LDKLEGIEFGSGNAEVGKKSKVYRAKGIELRAGNLGERLKVGSRDTEKVRR
jgi:hypothetical protein